MTITQLVKNPFSVGDSGLFIDSGSELITEDGKKIILGHVEMIHVASVSHPYSYEQETLDGEIHTVNIPGEVTFWADDYQIREEGKEIPDNNQEIRRNLTPETQEERTSRRSHFDIDKYIRIKDGAFYRVPVDENMIEFCNLNALKKTYPIYPFFVK